MAELNNAVFPESFSRATSRVTQNEITLWVISTYVINPTIRLHVPNSVADKERVTIIININPVIIRIRPITKLIKPEYVTLTFDNTFNLFKCQSGFKLDLTILRKPFLKKTQFTIH